MAKLQLSKSGSQVRTWKVPSLNLFENRRKGDKAVFRWLRHHAAWPVRDSLPLVSLVNSTGTCRGARQLGLRRADHALKFDRCADAKHCRVGNAARGGVDGIDRAAARMKDV
jgi:hypothetical protein